MSALATEHRRPRSRTARRARRGSALIGALVVAASLLGLVFATTVVSSVEVRESRRSIDDVRAQYVAEAGFERTMQLLREAVRKTEVYDPLGGLENVVARAGGGHTFEAVPLLDGDTVLGEFTVSMQVVERDEDSITIAVASTGYLPAAPQNLGPRQQLRAWQAHQTTVRFSVAPSEVFDNAYFINNWGWFYGDTIVANGNARSNGQFDAANYRPWANGQPLYDGVVWNEGQPNLLGYQDDNGDGLEDGGDGGIYAGWDVIRAQNVRGVGGNEENQHAYEERVHMPNLSNLTVYEAEAAAAAGTISINGATVTDAVYGDEAGERQNLYLVGTATSPIVLDGPIVVRGDVIISGYVTGQGAIYTGGNVYCPNSITYVNPPTTARPANNTQAATEAWLEQNRDRDFLGLFAAENIVVGDHTHSTWRSYVSGWMNNSMNESEEDSGEDGIPHTHLGRDGIHGTADDDVLENDNVFTTEYYSEQDEEYGLIPPGYGVGDRIPGSGEDIDGDGEYDDRTGLADIDLSSALTTANWGGNMPAAGIARYRDISTLYANRFDAVFYTNHSFCWVVLGSQVARINGSLVSRNENIVYGTPSVEFNHDCRLLGGISGIAGSLLPQVVRPPEIVRWERLDRDPNRVAPAAEGEESETPPQITQ